MTGAAARRQRIDLVNEHDARSIGVGLSEDFANGRRNTSEVTILLALPRRVAGRDKMHSGLTGQRAGKGCLAGSWQSGKQQTFRACTPGKRAIYVSPKISREIKAPLFGRSQTVQFREQGAIFVPMLIVKQLSQACRRPFGSEVRAYRDGQGFQCDSAGKLLMDFSGRPSAGDRLDHGADGAPIERRHDDPVLGEADEFTRQQAEIGSDPDDRATQLHRGANCGAVSCGLSGRGFVRTLEDDNSASSRDGRSSDQILAIQHRCFEPKNVLTQYFIDRVDVIGMGYLDDCQRVGSPQAGEYVARRLKCPSKQNRRRRFVGVQNRARIAVELVVALIFKL